MFNKFFKWVRVQIKLWNKSQQHEFILPLPESSNIKSALYSKTDKTLIIHFHNGGVYSYDEVPYDVVRMWCMADSTGKFFHKFIKGSDKNHPLYVYHKIH